MTETELERETTGEAHVAARPSLLERLRGLFGLGGASIRDDIQIALEDTAASEDLSAQERAMLKNVLNLHELRVADVMVPRADIIAVGLDTTLREVLSLFRTAGHSRLPVHAETLDDPRGMVHIRDFLDYLAASAEAAVALKRKSGGAAETQSDEPAGMKYASALDLNMPLAQANILRPVLFAPPSMPALDLLVKMQATRTHMALVIDEYGGTDGLVSIEDIVEMIVGDIEDEHDLDDEPQITPAADGTFVVDARASLEDASKAVGIALAGDDISEEIDTVGGLIASIAGRVPVRGEIVADPARAIEYEILDADPRRVKRIKLHLRDGEKAAAAEARETAPTATGK
ncbi:MAG: hemolysin (HlyC) family protein [Methylobacteriaceae bacterium]|jgi:CBS domain containing-hemolysin-like protein|nr:hemolysin (HlyC) family protein [Methylobacteriaceae bacterium]